MTPDQVKLVQESFAKVAPISDQAAVLFYDRLFEIAPQVKSMFPADMTEQRKKLMATLASVVNGFGNLESVLPAASALATRHVSYGARKEHYPVVGAVLLWTLEKGLGDALDARSRGCLDRGVRHAVRLHDFRSLWPSSSRRVRRSRERTAGCRR